MYKNDSELVILNSYASAGFAAKAELYETYDRLRDLVASGPTLGGSGMGKFSSVLVNIARMFGAAPFVPTLGSEAVNIPGTSYYQPFSGGTGMTNGGQAAFGLAPFAQQAGFPTGGAAPIDGSGVTPLSMLSSTGIGGAQASISGYNGIGAYGNNPALAGGMVIGGAFPVSAVGSAVGNTAGVTAGMGFGRNWVMPAAGIVSGIGGVLTTLGPFFGPFGIAAAAGGTVLNGVAGAVLSSYQTISQRILNNADTILSAKVKNLETVVKQLDAQQDILKKLLKESVDGDKKLLDNI